MSPPETAIHAAVTAARQSPCQKSKRGAVLFHPTTGLVTYGSWNSRPDNKCDERCQPKASDLVRGSVPGFGHSSRCSMLCIHAEVRAIRLAGYLSERSQFISGGGDAFVLTDLELVHAKVDARGKLVPSGGPSCWQCAKEVADTGIRGVWLYETHSVGMEGVEEGWDFYPNAKFCEITLRECRLA